MFDESRRGQVDTRRDEVAVICVWPSMARDDQRHKTIIPDDEKIRSVGMIVRMRHDCEEGLSHTMCLEQRCQREVEQHVTIDD
jgi:hypothetical protein